jgi:hypothetical protein
VHCVGGRGECNTTLWPHENRAQVGRGTNGFCRAHNDSDQACVAWSNQTQE